MCRVAGSTTSPNRSANCTSSSDASVRSRCSDARKSGPGRPLEKVLLDLCLLSSSSTEDPLLWFISVAPGAFFGNQNRIQRAVPRRLASFRCLPYSSSSCTIAAFCSSVILSARRPATSSSNSWPSWSSFAFAHIFVNSCSSPIGGAASFAVAPRPASPGGGEPGLFTGTTQVPSGGRKYTGTFFAIACTLFASPASATYSAAQLSAAAAAFLRNFSCCLRTSALVFARDCPAAVPSKSTDPGPLASRPRISNSASPCAAAISRRNCSNKSSDRSRTW
mmetsp:Transcript_9291/g.22832  ORF Transcript_9291/g.22832 Transcript_9291/m.22832 type:complete len:278 (-) Transcript_9291:905-1738(-)